MSRTARAVFVDGEMIGYLPVTDAENVEYGNSNVKLALDGLSSGKVDKSGDTMSGQLNIDFHDGTTLNDGFSVMSLGNSIPTGTVGNSQGIIDFYAPTGNIVRFYTADNITARRFVQLPDADGTLALKSDIPNITVLEIDTTGKSLNTAYLESLPTGYTRDNCIMSTACFIKYGAQYSMFSLIDDPDLAIAIGINSSSQLDYTLKGSQTLDGILKVMLIKY